MSLQIPVQKDIGEYQEKIVGKMSLRTLVCTSCGFASAIVAACIVYFCFGVAVSNATLPVMVSALPFWLAGFWRPFGMKLEEFIPLFINHHLTDQRLYYVATFVAFPLPQTGPRTQHVSRRQRRKAKRKGAELYEPSKQTA